MNASHRVEDAGSKLGRCGDGSRIISLSGGAPRVARGSVSARINPTSKCAQSVPEEFFRRSIRCTLRSPNLGDLVNSKIRSPSSPCVHHHQEFFPFLNYFSFFLLSPRSFRGPTLDPQQLLEDPPMARCDWLVRLDGRA